MKTTLRVLNLAFATIVVAVMAVVWLAFNPAGLTATEYIDRQQAFIRALNVPMPVLGAITIILSFLCAFSWRRDRYSLFLFVAAALLLVASGIVTRFCNQPINAIVMTWAANAPPSNWEVLRDEWWHWHLIRTFTGIGALVLLIAGHYRSRVVDSPGRQSA